MFSRPVSYWVSQYISLPWYEISILTHNGVAPVADPKTLGMLTTVLTQVLVLAYIGADLIMAHDVHINVSNGITTTLMNKKAKLKLGLVQTEDRLLYTQQSQHNMQHCARVPSPSLLKNHALFIYSSTLTRSNSLKKTSPTPTSSIPP